MNHLLPSGYFKVLLQALYFPTTSLPRHIRTGTSVLIFNAIQDLNTNQSPVLNKLLGCPVLPPGPVELSCNIHATSSATAMSFSSSCHVCWCSAASACTGTLCVFFQHTALWFLPLGIGENLLHPLLCMCPSGAAASLTSGMSPLHIDMTMAHCYHY